MKQIVRYFSVLVLLMCSAVAFAEGSKVEIAELDNGTVTSSLNGQTCTLTVTPASGYYIRKSDITVYKTVNPALTRSAVDLADVLTLDGNDPEALSAMRVYTFNIPEGYDAYVEASFTACTAIAPTVNTSDWTYGETVVSPAVTGNEGNATVSYSYAAKGSADFSPIVPTAAGSYTLKATIPAIGIYTAAEATMDFAIKPASLTVKAGNYTKKQGDPMPAFTLTYEGFKNGETNAVLTKQPTVTCEATEASAPGEYAVQVSGAEAQNYTISYAAGKLVVTEADAVVITAKSYTRKYGEANPAFEYETSGAALDGKPEIICEATATSPVGTYEIVVKQGSVKNYNVAYVMGTLTIEPAPLTVKAGTYTKKQGDPIPEFTLTYEGFKNGETNAVLTKQPTVSCEATEASAPGEYAVQVSGAEAQNYTISYAAGKLIVTEADAVVITAKSYTRKYGEENPTFEYETSGAALDGKPEISCGATATSPVGTYEIVVKQGSVKNYNVAYVMGTLTIEPAPLTIKAGTYTKKQGDAMPQFTLTYEGFKNGETEAVLTKQPSVNCEAKEASAPGEYAVQVTGAEAQNYTISYAAGKLIVTEADAVVITAKSYTRKYGEANPTFEYETSGAALDGKPEISCEATATSPVGTYEIVVKQGSVKNYNVTYVMGTLTIEPAPLTVKAGTYTKKQGDPMPAFKLEYEGFKNGETEAVLTKQPTVSCEATEASAPGEYAVQVTGAEAQNYTISYAAGKLIVTEADAVVITAKSYTRKYGEANPTFEYETSGAALDGKPEISCEATATSPVGTYEIVVKQGSVKNYNVAYVMGTLTIEPAPLTVKAGTYTKKQGDPMPAFTLTYEGFKNGETSAVLTKQPAVTCEATVASAPGEYAVQVSGAEAQNYAISYAAGKLIVTDADAVLITAKSYTRKYGEANPAFEYETSGAALDGKPEISCETTATSPVGTYPIMIKKGGVTNYNDSYVDGVLTITKAPLTIGVDSYTKRQYDPMPEFVVSYEGFVNGETETVLTMQATILCEADENSQPGEYVITVSGAEAGNYDISYVAGKLTVLEPDGISNAAQQKPYIVRICSVGGKPRRELQKGVNIVLMSDCTTRKVVMK